MRRATLPTVAAAATVALLAAGCASTRSLFDPAAARERQAEVDRRIVELEKQVTKSTLEIERLRRQVERLEADAATAPQREGAKAEAPAPGEVPEPAPPANPVAAEPIEESDLDLAPAGAAPAGGEVGEYEAALRLLRDGRPAEAEKALTAFLAAHPTSDLDDNAWFWIGESRRVRQDSAGALAAYRSGVERYPEGNKTPDALYRIGSCLRLEGDPAKADEVWRELVRRFPGTAAAERAREELGSGAPGPS
jgi:tol-pal system protein YbgF